MRKDEIVSYYRENITDWYTNKTLYGFGEFSEKNAEVPIEKYIYISVNNNQWEWVHDSFVSWKFAGIIIELFKQSKNVNCDSNMAAVFVGDKIKRETKISWSRK